MRHMKHPIYRTTGALTLCLVLAACLALAAPAAMARPACVYQDAFLFDSTTYNAYLVGTIPAPAPVELVRLGRKWSFVSYDGESGYVATRHLISNSGARPDPPPGVWEQEAESQTLRREIDPLTSPYFPGGVRFGLRGRGIGFGGNYVGDPYFAGFRRTPWTNRVNWGRASYLPPDSPKWAVCGLAGGSVHRAIRRAR